MQNPSLPLWLVEKNAQRAISRPVALPVHVTHALPTTVQTFNTVRSESRRVNPVIDIDYFECDVPCYENHSDDIPEGLDTFEFSLSIE